MRCSLHCYSKIQNKKCRRLLICFGVCLDLHIFFRGKFVKIPCKNYSRFIHYPSSKYNTFCANFQKLLSYRKLVKADFCVMCTSFVSVGRNNNIAIISSHPSIIKFCKDQLPVALSLVILSGVIDRDFINPCRICGISIEIDR